MTFGWYYYDEYTCIEQSEDPIDLIDRAIKKDPKRHKEIRFGQLRNASVGTFVGFDDFQDMIDAGSNDVLYVVTTAMSDYGFDPFIAYQDESPKPDFKDGREAFYWASEHVKFSEKIIQGVYPFPMQKCNSGWSIYGNIKNPIATIEYNGKFVLNERGTTKEFDSLKEAVECSKILQYKQQQ